MSDRIRSFSSPYSQAGVSSLHEFRLHYSACVLSSGGGKSTGEPFCLGLCLDLTSGKETEVAEELIMQLPTQTWFCGKLPVIINCGLSAAPLSSFFHLLGKKGVM